MTDPDPDPDPDPELTFAELGLRAELLEVLSSLGYEEPTPIQRAAIPVLLEGQDVVGQAATGTGKTAAFALPILEHLEPGRRGVEPAALVLVPTRELAMQVSEAIHRYGRPLRVRVLPIYGGQPIVRQLRSLQGGVDVVVATPGRAVDHLGRQTLRLGSLRTLVLDEADEMLDMGFADDLDTIFDSAPADRQTVLFSATMPGRIDAIARRHLRDAVRIRIAEPPTLEHETPRVRHIAYMVQRAHKAVALGRVLDMEAPAAALVFCRTRDVVDSLTDTLNGRGYRAEALHGGMSQEQRDRVMGRLRGGLAELLVATDVAARGLDVEQLSHVVNYDVPSSVDSYVHRIGRVGRAGREGVAITLTEPREHRMLKSIERVTKRRIALQTVPTIADLRARRLDLTSAALRELLVEDDLDGFRVVVESLSDEFDLMAVALAAVQLAHRAVSGSGDGEVDIPAVVAPASEHPRSDRSHAASRPGSQRRAPSTSPARGEGMARAWREGGRAGGWAGRSASGPVDREGGRAGRSASGSTDREGRGSQRGGASGPVDRAGEWAGRSASGPVDRAGRGSQGRAPSRASARLYVGAGRDDGLRPQDLVGAITGETRLDGRDIGAIEVAARFSLVEVPEGAMSEVIGALQRAKIRGRRVTVRRDRF